MFWGLFNWNDKKEMQQQQQQHRPNNNDNNFKKICKTHCNMYPFNDSIGAIKFITKLANAKIKNTSRKEKNENKDKENNRRTDRLQSFLICH